MIPLPAQTSTIVASTIPAAPRPRHPRLRARSAAARGQPTSTAAAPRRRQPGNMMPGRWQRTSMPWSRSGKWKGPCAWCIYSCCKYHWLLSLQLRFEAPPLHVAHLARCRVMPSAVALRWTRHAASGQPSPSRPAAMVRCSRQLLTLNVHCQLTCPPHSNVAS